MTNSTTTNSAKRTVMDQSIEQLRAAARIIGYCEGLVGSGILSEDIEMNLRERIAEARSAFRLYRQVEEAA